MLIKKSLNFRTNIIFTILILSLLFQTYSQIIEEIKIGEKVKGNIFLDEGHKYYQLTIPRNEL